MGIITVDAAPDLAVRRYVLASRPSADVAPGVRRPADMVPVMKAEVDPKKAVACPTARSAPTTAQNARTMVLLLVLLRQGPRGGVGGKDLTRANGDVWIAHAEKYILCSGRPVLVLLRRVSCRSEESTHEWLFLLAEQRAYSVLPKNSNNFREIC